jgi:hypothetical protein
MFALLASPIVLSALLLAAHFLRGGQAALVSLCLALPLLLAVRRPWAGWLITVGLGLGGLEWLLTLIDIAQQRMAMGEPWLRMAAILGTVTLLTVASALTPRHRHLARHFSVCGARADGAHSIPEVAS